MMINRFGNIFLCMLMFFSMLDARAQSVVISHSLPSGYTTLQTRSRNGLEIDIQDNKWIAFGSIGIGKYDGSAWVMFDSLTSGLPSDSVTAVDSDAAGNIWAGTRLGAAFYNGSNWLTYNSSNSGLPSNLITAVYVSGTGIWFGTKTGAVKYDGITWTSYTTSNSGLVNDTVTKICGGPGNEIWIGTQNGLSRFSSGTWNTFNSDNTIISNDRIFDMTADQSGRLWVIPYPVINAPNLYFIDGGAVHAYMEEFYSESYGQTYGKAPVCVSPSGLITLFINAPDPAIMFIDGLNYRLQYFSPGGPGPSPGSFLGSDALAYDSQGHLWYLDGYPGSFPILEMETDNYVIPYLYPTIYNAKYLDINDARALLLNRGHLMYQDYPTGWAYEIPKGSGRTTMYASSLWIGGRDSSETIHVAAEGYYPGYDYFPGPVAGISVPFDSSSCASFNRMWNVYRWQIESFQDHFASGAVSNGSYEVPEVILNWPAKGNGLIIDDMAPFVDFDGNGSYDPYSGDYPEIKGDQSVFWMFNDSLSAHLHSNAPKVGVEVLATAYAYACPGIADSNSVLNTSTFYNYTIRNRSELDYSDFYMGLWCSVELGYYDDNYIGCDTMLHAGFIYNSDSLDNGPNGYGLAPPMQNVVVLKGPEADPGDGLDNDLDGTTDETGERTTMNHFTWYIGDPVPWGWPLAPHEFYNYLQSIWRDSTHMVYGGYGHDPSSSDSVNFLYPGKPYDAGWTEINEGNYPGSRMFLIGTGPVSLPAGGKITLDFAYVFTRDSLNPNGLNTSVARNIADVQRVHDWFNNQNFPSCLNYSVGTENIFDEKQHLKIYPNPAKEVIYLDVQGGFKNDRVEVTDMTGRLVYSRRYYLDSGIDISLLQDGVYTVRVIRKNSVLNGKFLKSH